MWIYGRLPNKYTAGARYTRICLALAMSLGGALHSTAFAKNDAPAASLTTQELQTVPGEFNIRLHGALNAMHEHCELVETSGLVSFSFNSRFPVAFDVHHHTDHETFYPIDVAGVTRFSDQFLAEGGREYCFHFVNEQFHHDRWSFTVQFDLLPIAEATR